MFLQLASLHSYSSGSALQCKFSHQTDVFSSQALSHGNPVPVLLDYNVKHNITIYNYKFDYAKGKKSDFVYRPPLTETTSNEDSHQIRIELYKSLLLQENIILF